MLEAMRKDKAKFVPKKGQGYNVVGIDDMEMPGEQCYLVGNYATKEAADEALTRFRAKYPDEAAYVYGPVE